MSEPFKTIDLNALKHNAELIKSWAPTHSILAMLKADAYGHGIVEVAQTIYPYVDAIGVARLDEAIALRNAQIKTRIVLMGGVCNADELAMACRLDADIVCHHTDHLSLLKNSTLKPTVWLKVNSQINRLGFDLNDIKDAITTLTQQCRIEPFAMILHLPCMGVDEKNDIKQQIMPFINKVKSYGYPLSISNSAGVVKHADLLFEEASIIRCGRLLYGFSPVAGVSAKELGLKPVMSAYASVISVHPVKAGKTVGYDRLYKAKQDEIIAILNIGYGDGYPRTTAGFVNFNGWQCDLRGQVSMDMMAVHIPKGCQIKLGDLVQLWGEGCPIEKVCEVNKRSTLEMVMPLAKRVQRIFIPVIEKNVESYEQEIN